MRFMFSKNFLYILHQQITVNLSKISSKFHQNSLKSLEKLPKITLTVLSNFPKFPGNFVKIF